jgi:hypothetical protein
MGDDPPGIQPATFADRVIRATGVADSWGRVYMLHMP